MAQHWLKTSYRQIAASMGYMLLLLLPLAVGAQTHEGEWQVSGFADTRQGVQMRSPRRLLTSYSRIRGEFTGTLGNSLLFASANATYNPIYSQPIHLDLRELYIEHRRKHWGLRVGRQLVIWGMADGVRVTDLISPMDMREFLAQDYDEIRMPVQAIRLFAHNDWMRMELVCVPLFEGFILPTDPASPWSILQKKTPLPMVWDDAASTPEKKVANMEYGGRIAFTLPGIDFSVSGLYTWNKMPAISYAFMGTHIAVLPQHYRMGCLGADIAKPLGDFVLRGEAAYSMDKHLSYRPSLLLQGGKGFHTLHWLAGVDWYGPSEWMVSAQFASETIFDHDAALNVPQHSKLTTLHLSKRLLGSTMQLASMTYYDWNDKGWFSRLSMDYAVDDHTRLGVGVDWLEGDAGLFKTYRENATGWVRLRYYF